MLPLVRFLEQSTVGKGVAGAASASVFDHEVNPGAQTSIWALSNLARGKVSAAVFSEYLPFLIRLLGYVDK